MKILFLMLEMPEGENASDMYLDLAMEFKRNGHEMTIMAPDVKYKRAFLREERGMKVVRVDSRQTQDVKNMIKKGIALATLNFYYKRAYKKYLSNEVFDWIIMPTPPITLSDFVCYVKKRTAAKFYLILRDIHPQSIWSIGLLKRRWMYKYIDKKARTGYKAADLIGCMSPGNIEFVKNQYPDISSNKLVVLYNWLSETKKITINGEVRKKYGLDGKFVVLFGGTIGKGQRIENIVFLAEHYKKVDNIAFVIIGKGVEKDRLELIAREKNLKNIIFIDFMPQTDYLQFVSSSDLGLITINENYAVPTCPSKAIAYMSLGIPVFAMINPNSDYGDWIEKAGAGYWTVGSDRDRAISLFDKLYTDESLRKEMKVKGYQYYLENCTESRAYETMIKQMTGIINA